MTVELLLRNIGLVVLFLAVAYCPSIAYGLGKDHRSSQSAHRRVQQKKLFGNHEQMMMVQSIPAEINVDPRSTYNHKFMALMNSPCRPEMDGFFGATSGVPIRVQYGFQLEIEPLSDIMSILDVIEDKIVDSVLMNTFPEMCGLRRRQLSEMEGKEEGKSRALVHTEGHPAGFRFLKFEEVGKCTPQVNDVNFCGVFTGVIYVYGKHKGETVAKMVASYIDRVFETSDPAEIHSEVADISSLEEYSVISGDVENPTSLVTTAENGKELSRLGILLIVISVMIVLAICYYYYIHWSDPQAGSTKMSIGGSTAASDYSQRRVKSKRRLWNKIFRRQQKHQYRDYDPEAKSIRHSYEEEQDENVSAVDIFEDESSFDEYNSRVSSSGRSSRMSEKELSKKSLLSSNMKDSRRSLDLEVMKLDSSYNRRSQKSKGHDQSSRASKGTTSRASRSTSSRASQSSSGGSQMSQKKSSKESALTTNNKPSSGRSEFLDMVETSFDMEKMSFDPLYDDKSHNSKTKKGELL